MGTVLRIGDGLKNLASGLGTAKAKTANRTVVYEPLNQYDAEALYNEDWLARKIIDIIPSEMVREWRNWETRQSEAIYETENRVRVKAQLEEAMVWGRLYGGGAILIGVESNDPLELFDPQTVKKDGLLYLHTFNRHELVVDPIDIETDLFSPDYGKPRILEIIDPYNGNSVKVHRSRFVIFDGLRCSRQIRQFNQGWGLSVFQAIRQTILNVSSTAMNAAEMTEEAKLDIIKIPNIAANFADPESERRLLTRFSFVDQIKSIINAIIIGGDEEYDRKTMNFAGLPELIRAHMELAAGAAETPLTLLLGTSPGGLNATGDSDLRNHYDNIRSKQTVLSDAIRKLDTAITRSATGRDVRNATYSWNPLWQATPAEKADVQFKAAQRDAIYAAFFPAAAFARTVRDELIAHTTYSTIDRNITDDDLEVLGDEPLPVHAAAAKAEAAIMPPEAGAPAANSNKPAAGKAGARRAVKDAAPKTLYVSRPVLNSRAIRRWAVGQGFNDLVPAGELHVTVSYSRTPVDWFKVGENYMGASDAMRIAPGGPRDVELFGPGVVVLLFASNELSWRWRDIIDAGGSWDYEEYQPHITFARSMPEGIGLGDIEPYQGPILLGPERFQTIDEDA